MIPTPLVFFPGHEDDKGPVKDMGKKKKKNKDRTEKKASPKEVKKTNKDKRKKKKRRDLVPEWSCHYHAVAGTLSAVRRNVCYPR